MLARQAPPVLPDPEEIDEMEEGERDRLERRLSHSGWHYLAPDLHRRGKGLPDPLSTQQVPQILKALREVTLVQSVESSNRIEVEKG